MRDATPRIEETFGAIAGRSGGIISMAMHILLRSGAAPISLAWNWERKYKECAGDLMPPASLRGMRPIITQGPLRGQQTGMWGYTGIKIKAGVLLLITCPYWYIHITGMPRKIYGKGAVELG